MQEGQNRPQINQDEGDYEQDGGDTNETAGNDDEDDIAMDMSDAELAEVIQENNDAIGASHQEVVSHKSAEYTPADHHSGSGCIWSRVFGTDSKFGSSKARASKQKATIP